MDIRYTTTLKDYIEANRVMHLHRGGLMKLRYWVYVQYAYAIGVILVAAGGLLLAGTIRHSFGISDDKMGFAVSMAVMGGGMGWLFNPLWHERKLARIFRRRKEPSECTISTDESGMALARIDGKQKDGSPGRFSKMDRD